MKKLIALILSMLLLLPLVSCEGNSGGTVNPYYNSSSGTPGSYDDNGNVDRQENKIQTVKAGDKIKTDSMEIKINSVKFSYDVMPDDTNGLYTHYPADAGKVYIEVDANVTNKAKQNLYCDEIGSIIADYNDGYTYRGFVIVKDSGTGFTYANITSIDPLETKGIKWLIECPEEVETSSKSLFLELTINSGKYKLVIR